MFTSLLYIIWSFISLYLIARIMRKDYTEMTEKEKPIFEPMTLEAIPARATIHKEPIRLPNGQFLNPRPASRQNGYWERARR